MLSFFENLMKLVDPKKVSQDGVPFKASELYHLFDHYGQELIDNYVLRGHATVFGTVIDIPETTITRIGLERMSNSIDIGRKDYKGNILNDLLLPYERYEKADIKVWYCDNKWIDMHIRISEDDYSNSLCLVFAPKMTKGSDK